MKRSLNLLLLVGLLLTACMPAENPPATATSAVQTTEIAVETPAPTEEPVNVLKVCTKSLPYGLFPYDGMNTVAKQNLLALIQREAFPPDGDVSGAAIFTEVPTQENGGIELQPVNVALGETIVDANGDLAVLKAGVMVRPSGCRSGDCALTWDGTEALSMDRMAVRFHLAEGLTWSDGTPLMASDSVASFELASDPDAPGLRWVENRTDRYTAENEYEILWTGVPGFSTANIEDLFWQPVPPYPFAADAAWDVIAGDPIWSDLIISLGPYQMGAWTDDNKKLVRNEFYNGPDLEYGEINFKLVPNREDALAAFSDGTCDLLDQSYHFEQDEEALSALQADPESVVLVEQTSSWSQLVFGIKPASYDDYYNPAVGDRPDLFGDARTREAIATCLDREAIQEVVYAGLAELWPSFVSPAESTLSAEQQLVHDSAQAIQLLEAVGWRDHDLDPSTPLQAWYVPNIPVNTSFNIALYVDPSTLSQQVAALVQSSLGECGIEVTPVTLPTGQLYAAGPEGVLFGRQFDLALIGWAPLSEMDCAIYEGDQIPSQGNQWIGTNIAGLSEALYDGVCTEASLALPNEWATALNLAESEYLNSLPAVPLFSVPETVIVNHGACSAVANLWNFGVDNGSGNSLCP